ncbi:MAG: BON domain-containing protein [Acidobacteriota bacterium]
MTAARILRQTALATAALAFIFTGCHRSHPDDAASVYQSLAQHDLASVQIDQDRGNGVITLNGVVGDQARKDRAQQLAQQSAPGYTIRNNLRVDNAGILGEANPNARPPQVQQMAHPPAPENKTAPKHKNTHQQ